MGEERESNRSLAKRLLKEVLTDVSNKAKSKIGDIVYEGLTHKNKDHDLIGKPLLELHQLIFGEMNTLESIERQENKENNRLVNRNKGYILRRKMQGDIWRQLLKTSKNGKDWVEMSFDAVDTLNEIQINRSIIEQIHKDLPRTFPSIDFFQGPELQLSMRKVLVAVSNYLPELGYVQGMNLIVAFLFLHFETEFEVFQFFMSMIEGRKFNLLGIFREGLPNLISFTSILERMIEDGDKELYDHLANIGIGKYIFAYQWILSLFTYSMEFEVVEEIWSLFFEDGWEVMFKVFLCLINNRRKDLMAADCDNAFKILRDSPTNVTKDFIAKVKMFSLKDEHQRMIDDVVLNALSF